MKLLECDILKDTLQNSLWSFMF